MKVFCVFSLESPPQGGDSNEYTKQPIFNITRKVDLNYLRSAATGFFLGTQARVRNSHGKRAISFRAIEVLLYLRKNRNRLSPQQGQLKILPDQEKKLHQSYLRCPNGLTRISDKLASRLEDPQVTLSIILATNFLFSFLT